MKESKSYQLATREKEKGKKKKPKGKKKSQIPSKVSKW
jgi:hypothetical protein